MKQNDLKETISLLEKELIRMHYKETTINYYRRLWKLLIRYFDDRNEKCFSEATAMDFVDSKCNFYEKEKNGLLTQSNMYLFRMVRMVGDFQLTGTVPRRYANSLSKVNSPEHIAILENFKMHCIKSEYSSSTIKSYYRIAESFLSFLEAKNISITMLNSKCITDFINSLAGYSYKMVEFMLCGTRNFLKFLKSLHLTKEDFSLNIPSLKVRKQTRIPSVWNKEDLTKLLNAIDRGNPAGKRDYAMILLVTRLGLRSIDVKRLRLSDIKWSDNKIEFIQKKTKELLSLPLLKDVGWAIIDYIKNGRPESEDDHVFLRHLAPITFFSDEDHLHQVIEKYMRSAKIPIAGKKKVGMHSLRHTLATTLLEQHVPLNEIAEILGHQDTETTSVYLKSSIELLRECTLNPYEL